VAIFRTPIATTRLYKRLYERLEHFFSPTTLIHGSLVDILGMGVLLLGKSGVGKSECALELVSKGHSLVADDVIRVICLGERFLEGSSPHLLRHYIEVRGLGIVDLSKLYGIRAVRSRKQIDMVITLEDWQPDTYVERVGLDQHTYSILGVALPHIMVPVKPGRNISTIVEVGARDQRLKLLGTHSAQEFNQRLMRVTKPEPSRDDSEDTLQI
jgi:HPr kinase/phosphorylase